jgi:hypothetical protein
MRRLRSLQTLEICNFKNFLYKDSYLFSLFAAEPANIDFANAFHLS